MSFIRNRVQRREALIVERVGIAACFNQQLNHLEIARSARRVERRPTRIVAHLEHSFGRDKCFGRSDEVFFQFFGHLVLDKKKVTKSAKKQKKI